MQTKDNAKFHIVLVIGAVEKKGKILIAKRSFEELQAPGKWALPGGKVEIKGSDMDTLEKTLAREIKEEVGVEVDSSMKYIRSGSFVRVDKSSVISVLFLCKWLNGKAEALEDSIDIAWISSDELDKYDFADDVKKSLRESFKIVNSNHI